MSTITIAGRHFRTAGRTTLRHDLALQAQILRAGLDVVEMPAGEEVSDFLERFSANMLHGRDNGALRLLSHVLIPAESGSAGWDESISDEVTAYLVDAAGSDREAAESVRLQLVAMLAGLVRGGATSIVQRVSMNETQRAA